MENFDNMYSEMMKTSVTDFAPVASGVRCLFLALKEESFTDQQALELCKCYFTAWCH